MRNLIDINDLDSGNTININNSMDDVNIGGSRSSNFGSGIELLMNDKMKSSSGNALSSDIDVDDLDNLENELKQVLSKQQEPAIILHADKTVDIEHVVKVMDIAYRNKYKIVLATKPN